MANKLTTYQIQDSQTGKTYTIEGPEGASADDLGQFILSQPSQEAAPAVPTAAPASAITPVVPSNQDVAPLKSVAVQELNPKSDFAFDPQTADEIKAAMGNPNIAPEDVEALVNQRLTQAGQAPLGIAGGPLAVAKYRQALTQKGAKPGELGYTSAAKQLIPHDQNTVSSDKEVSDVLGKGLEGSTLGALIQAFPHAAGAIVRGYQSGVQYGTPGFLARSAYQYFSNIGTDELKKRFPQATDDQIEALRKNIITETQRNIRDNNAGVTENDPMWANLTGMLPASVGLEDFVPGGEVAGIAKRTGRATVQNTTADMGYQALDVHQGVQDEYNPEQTLQAAGLGTTLHLGMEGVHAAVSHLPTSKAPTLDSEGEPVTPQGIAVPTARKNSNAYKEQLTETRQAMADHINNTVKKWTNSPEFEVHENFKNIDGVDNSAIGVHTGDKILINGQKVLETAKKFKASPEDVINAAVFHEALGHHGMSQLFGDALEDTLTKFYDNGVSTFKNEVDKWMADNPDAYKDRPNRLALSIEEVLAEKSEKGQLPVTLKDKVSNKVKQFARRMGVDLKYSEREIASILGMAHDSVVNGKARDVRSNGYKFMNVGEKALLPIEDQANRIRAQVADARGTKTSDEIYKDYGWWKDQDGKWRTRMSDSESALYAPHEEASASYLETELPKAKEGEHLFLGQVLHHPDLYKAYPWLENMRIFKSDNAHNLGGYHPKEKVLSLNPEAIKKEGEDLHSVLLHEIQHAIQDHEGFASGGNSENALPRTLKDHEIIPAAEKLYEDRKAEIERLDDTAEGLRDAIANPITKNNPELLKKFKDRLDEVTTDANYKHQALEDLHESLRHQDKGDLKDWVLRAYQTKHEAYEWLMGEIEARETEALKNVPQEGLKNIGQVGSVEKKHPDYIRITRNANAAKSAKYMRQYKPAAEEQAAIDSAKETIKGALDNYTPKYSSWAEGKRAARDKGLTVSQIRKSKNIVGELDKRLFQYDAVAQKTDEKLAELHHRMDTAQFTMADKARYLETVFQFNEMTARIFEDQAEIGRALNAMKALAYTKNKLSKLNDLLGEYDDHVLSGFADEKTFNEFADQVKYLMETQNVNGAHMALRNVMKPYWWEYVLSFRHNMMLSGLGTHAKNLKDNALMLAREMEETVLASPGFVVRKGLQKVGANAEDGVSPQEVVGRLYGILRAALDTTTYMKTLDAFRKGHDNRILNPKLEQQGARIPVVSKVSDALYAADTFFRAFNMNANMYALGVRRARDEGLKGLAAFEEGSNYAANPSEKMLKEAKAATDLTLLVDTPSLLSSKLEGAKSIRPNMKPTEQVGAFLANFAFPFFRVTDRLLFQQIRRSPLSFLDKNTRADFAAGGARRDIAIARTLYGSALMAYYWYAHGQGKNTGQGPNDYKKVQALQAGGWQANSVVDNGKYSDATAVNLSLLPNGLDNQVASNVASIRDAWDSGKVDAKGTAESLKLSMYALSSILEKSSWANSLEPYLEPFQVGKSEGETDTNSANLFGGWATSFIPAAVKQYNQAVGDPIQRDTTGDKTLGDRVQGKIMAAIPGLSEKLPAKYDVYGDQMKQGRSISGLSNYQDIKTDEVSKELQKLEKTTPKAVVTGAPSSFEYNGETVSLNASAKQEWQRVQGFYLREMMKSSIASGEWKTASQAEKISIVKDMHKEAHTAAKEYMLPLLGLGDDTNEEGSPND